LNSGAKAFAFGFIDWRKTENDRFVKVGYQTKYPYNENDLNTFSNYMVLNRGDANQKL